MNSWTITNYLSANSHDLLIDQDLFFSKICPCRLTFHPKTSQPKDHGKIGMENAKCTGPVQASSHAV